MIVPYMEETTDEFPIYSDPSGRIYDKLQMKRTTAFSDPPPYAELSLGSSFVKCMKQMWKRGLAGFKGGNWDQQGGEWIFVDGKLRYAHRMEASNDHLTADRLMDILKMDQDHKGMEVVMPETPCAEEGPQVKGTQVREEKVIEAKDCRDEVEAPTII